MILAIERINGDEDTLLSEVPSERRCGYGKYDVAVVASLPILAG